METIIYIPEAGTLIDCIHEIKQWVYEGSVRLLIPTCTFEQVEKTCKALNTPKDVQKDAGATRSSGKAGRKEQPLFDINPRATWEFLARARSEKGEEGIRFQREGEEFTQWKQEDERAAEKEQAALTPTAPTTFAEALLRKLNLKDGTGSDMSKAPPKPRLVARSNEPKSPWKYHKVPTVSSQGISQALRPLYSCALWHVYEHEKNPLLSETFMLLVKTKDLQLAAEKLEIPTLTNAELGSSIRARRLKLDRRTRFGELEMTFPETHTSDNTAIDETVISDVKVDGKAASMVNGHTKEDTEDQPFTVEECKALINSKEKNVQSQDMQVSKVDLEPEVKEKLDASEISSAPDHTPKIQIQSPQLHLQDSTNELATAPVPGANAKLETQEVQLPERKGPDSLSSPVFLSRPSTAADVTKDKESDVDSDEEVIVFNPRARRASGRKQRENPRSRPTTSNGAVPKILRAGPKDVVSRPQTAGQASSRAEEEAVAPKSPTTPDADDTLPRPSEKAPSGAFEKLKPRIESTLKPESPVFTPGKPFVVAQSQPIKAATASPTSPELNKSSPPKSPSLPVNGRSAPPRQPRAIMQQRQASQEQLRLQRENQQRESERMIQRQREAIQRRARATEKPIKKVEERVEDAPVEKPPPRQIQMVPTDNPTVIDPDAFDRSYVVQAPNSSPSTANNSSAEKRRPKSHHLRGNGNKRSQSSPKRGKEATEADVDFVLKSGAPRGSLRGKGKLWVP